MSYFQTDQESGLRNHVSEYWESTYTGSGSHSGQGTHEEVLVEVKGHFSWLVYTSVGRGLGRKTENGTRHHPGRRWKPRRWWRKWAAGWWRLLLFPLHLPLTSRSKPGKLGFEIFAQLSLLLHHVIMELMKRLIEALYSLCVAFAKGGANLKINVSKANLFQKLITQKCLHKSGQNESNFTYSPPKIL